MLLRTASLALATTLALGGTAAVAAPEAPAIAHTVNVKAPAPAPHDDVSSYADREQQDPKTADFQGGEVMVVGVTGGALILILVLLLILV